MRSRVAFAFFCALSASAAAQGEPRFRRDGVERPEGAPHPDIIYPDNLPSFPEGFVMRRPISRDDRQAARTTPDPNEINLPREVPAKLSACWSPPSVEENELAEVTVRLSFNADGGVIGMPATPYLKAITDDKRRALRDSLLAAIKTCTPLRFTPSLGRAIAGRIFAVRFIVHHVTFDKRI